MISNIVQDFTEVQGFLVMHANVSNDIEHQALLETQVAQLRAKVEIATISVPDATALMELINKGPWSAPKKTNT